MKLSGSLLTRPFNYLFVFMSLKNDIILPVKLPPHQCIFKTSTQMKWNYANEDDVSEGGSDLVMISRNLKPVLKHQLCWFGQTE